MRTKDLRFYLKVEISICFSFSHLFVRVSGLLKIRLFVAFYELTQSTF
jgi:hypothetical protein